MSLQKGVAMDAIMSVVGHRHTSVYRESGNNRSETIFCTYEENTFSSNKKRFRDYFLKDESMNRNFAERNI